jgi:hypothetical protein
MQALRELAGGQVSGEELGQSVALSMRQSWGQLPCHIQELPGTLRCCPGGLVEAVLRFGREWGGQPIGNAWMRGR